MKGNSFLILIALLISSLSFGMAESKYLPQKKPLIETMNPKPALYLMLDTASNTGSGKQKLPLEWFLDEVPEEIVTQHQNDTDGGKAFLESVNREFCDAGKVKIVMRDEKYVAEGVCKVKPVLDIIKKMTKATLRAYEDSAYLGWGTTGQQAIFLPERNYTSRAVQQPIVDFSLPENDLEEQFTRIDALISRGSTPVYSGLYEAIKLFKGDGYVIERGSQPISPPNSGLIASSSRIKYGHAPTPLHYRCQQNHIVYLGLNGVKVLGGDKDVRVFNIHQDDVDRRNKYSNLISDGGVIPALGYKHPHFKHYQVQSRIESTGSNQSLTASGLANDFKYLMEDIDLRNADKPIAYDLNDITHKNPHGYGTAWKSDTEIFNKELDDAGKAWESEGSSNPLSITFSALQMLLDPKDEINSHIGHMVTKGGFKRSAITAHDFSVYLNEAFASSVGMPSGSSSAQSQYGITDNTFRFTSYYNPHAWSGGLKAHKFNFETNNWDELVWNTVDFVKHSYDLLTLNGKNSTSMLTPNAVSHYGKLSGTQLNWLRGFNKIDSAEVRSRTHAIGDIVDSDIVYYATDRAYINLNLLGVAQRKNFVDYIAYRNNSPALQRNLVIAGANDGLIHLINADTRNKSNYNRPGTRYFSIFPAFLTPRIEEIAGPNSAGHFTMNGPANIFDFQHTIDDYATVAVNMMGSGGKGMVAYLLAAVNHTGDQEFKVRVSEPKILWEIENETSRATKGFEKLGYTFSNVEMYNRVEPNTQRPQAIIVFGNGYNVTDSGQGKGSTLYFIDLYSGKLIRSIDLDGTGRGASTPSLYVVEDKKTGYQHLEAVYVGTFDGSLYKLDIGSKDIENFVADKNNKVKIFDTNRKPIMARPTIAEDSMGGRWIYFGTGQNFTPNDRDSIAQNYFVALKDPIKDIGTGKYKTFIKEDLKEWSLKQTYLHQLTENDSSGQIYNSDPSGVYQIDLIEIDKNDVPNHGWIVNFGTGRLTGERMIHSAQIYDKTYVHFNTWGIEGYYDHNDPCFGDRLFGKRMSLDMTTGAIGSMLYGTNQQNIAGLGMIGAAPGQNTGDDLVSEMFTGGGTNGGNRLTDEEINQISPNRIGSSYEIPSERNHYYTSSDLGDGLTNTTKHKKPVHGLPVGRHYLRQI